MPDIVKFEEQYVIVFHDKSRVHLTHEDWRKFMDAMATGSEGIMLRSNYFRFSSVSKILTQQEFYQQYPELIPAPASPTVTATASGQLSEARMRAGWLRACQAAIQASPKLRAAGLDGVFIRSAVKRYGFTRKKLGLEELQTVPF